MSKKKVYKIHLLKWKEHNPKSKPSFKKTMVANNFCTDSKLSVLPLTHRWLFLGLILECGNHNSDVVVMSERQLRALLESSRSVVRALDALQSLQVLTYQVEEFSTLIEVKLNEIKLNKKKINEEKRSAPEVAHEPELLLSAELTRPPKKQTHELSDLWNQNCGTLPKIKLCVGKRLDQAKKRWPEQPPESWVETIKKMAESDFCKGSTGWVATFDWLMKPGNWLKVSEGNYDNNRSFKKTQQTINYDNLDALERKWQEKGGNA